MELYAWFLVLTLDSSGFTDPSKSEMIERGFATQQACEAARDALTEGVTVGFATDKGYRCEYQPEWVKNSYPNRPEGIHEGWEKAMSVK